MNSWFLWFACFLFCFVGSTWDFLTFESLIQSLNSCDIHLESAKCEDNLQKLKNNEIKGMFTGTIERLTHIFTYSRGRVLLIKKKKKNVKISLCHFVQSVESKELFFTVCFLIICPS